MSFASCVSELAAYGRERIGTARVLALVVLIVAISLASEMPPVLADLAARVVLLVLLIATFRLWDDLGDREYDRKYHPNRVLAGDVNVRCFWILFAVLNLSILAMLATLESGTARVLAYAIFVAVLFMMYRQPLKSAAGRFVRTQVVLLKYPFFLLLPLAQPAARWSIAGALACYMVLSAHEWRDDGLPDRSALLRRAGTGGAVALIFIWVILHG